jgi:hypothetical protein
MERLLNNHPRGIITGPPPHQRAPWPEFPAKSKNTNSSGFRGLSRDHPNPFSNNSHTGTDRDSADRDSADRDSTDPDRRDNAA